MLIILTGILSLETWAATNETGGNELALLGLKPGWEISPDDANEIREYLATKINIGFPNRFLPTRKTDIQLKKTVLHVDRGKYVTCGLEDCAIMAGEILGVNYVVFGSLFIQKETKQILLSLSFLNTKGIEMRAKNIGVFKVYQPLSSFALHSERIMKIIRVAIQKDVEERSSPLAAKLKRLRKTVIRRTMEEFEDIYVDVRLFRNVKTYFEDGYHYLFFPVFLQVVNLSKYPVSLSVDDMNLRNDGGRELTILRKVKDVINIINTDGDANVLYKNDLIGNVKSRAFHGGVIYPGEIKQGIIYFRPEAWNSRRINVVYNGIRIGKRIIGPYIGRFTKK